jgi:hypothetical protein
MNREVNRDFQAVLRPCRDRLRVYRHKLFVVSKFSGARVGRLPNVGHLHAGELYEAETRS